MFINEADALTNNVIEKLKVRSSTSTDGRSNRRCFMPDTCFLDPDGHHVAAKDLAVDMSVLDAERNLVKVTWAEVHPTAPRDIVELSTKSTKTIVTNSHRIPLKSGEVKDAKLLKKGDDVMVYIIHLRLGAILLDS